MGRPRIPLANLPTPLQHFAALDAIVGCEVWVKRDDMTGGVESGNKVRKLEYLLADARAAGADTVITCGGFQSNHCRATAVVARAVGMRAELLLRTDDGQPEPLTGNPLLSALAGARQHVVTPAEYRDRSALMTALAEELRVRGKRPYVIPEGGSNAIGALGYVDAMAELQAQLEGGQAGGEPFDVIAVACGSGGTAAGIAEGLSRHPVAERVWAFAVCDDRQYFEPLIAELRAGVTALLPPAKTAAAPLEILDQWKGPRYGVSSTEQLALLHRVAHATGLMLDPAYTGKALFGLAHHPQRPRRVCFLHTGGAWGLLGTPQVADAGVEFPSRLRGVNG